MDVKSKLRVIRNIKPSQRKRTRPVRKWKNSEITLLINYLIENREFEKPTQRIYYLDFIRQYDIDIPWDLIKGKVRNLRTKYEKLRDLYRCRDHGESPKVNLDVIERNCPHFDKLAEIFDSKPVISIKNETTTWETDISVSQNQLMDQEQDTVAAASLDSLDIINSFQMVQDEFVEQSKIGASPKPQHEQITITNVTGNSSTNPIPENISIPSDLDLEMLKFNFEKEKFCRRQALREKKFDFKMESVRKKIALKKLELELDKMRMESYFHLEKLRLEIDERTTINKLGRERHEDGTVK